MLVVVRGSQLLQSPCLVSVFHFLLVIPRLLVPVCVCEADISGNASTDGVQSRIHEIRSVLINH